MTTKKIYSFRFIPGYAIGRPVEVWLWTDDSGEDSDFLAWVSASGGGSGYTVDRSGPVTQLTWTAWDGSHSLDMPADTAWGPQSTTIGTNSYPGQVDTTGTWDCDDYGRPFDLNDLLA